jgi:hypothetical protein
MASTQKASTALRLILEQKEREYVAMQIKEVVYRKQKEVLHGEIAQIKLALQEITVEVR